MTPALKMHEKTMTNPEQLAKARTLVAKIEGLLIEEKEVTVAYLAWAVLMTKEKNALPEFQGAILPDCMLNSFLDI
jgi:hypothetical protein